jgi:Mrp family chromosome partitioning ATPase
MTRHVYVMALEAGTGKSAVVLGLAEVLSRRATGSRCSGRSSPPPIHRIPTSS